MGFPILVRWHLYIESGPRILVVFYSMFWWCRLLLNHPFYWWPMYISHYDDVIMTMLASQITSLTVVYSIVYSGVNQRKHQSSASLAFVREIHRGPVNFPHKWPVTRKMFPFDDVIMTSMYITTPASNTDSVGVVKRVLTLTKFSVIYSSPAVLIKPQSPTKDLR